MRPQAIRRHREEDDRGLDLITERAKASERAPRNGDEIAFGVTDRLMRFGIIRVEIWGKNWRVIEIMSGQYRGLRTAEPPPALNWSCWRKLPVGRLPFPAPHVKNEGLHRMGTR